MMDFQILGKEIQIFSEGNPSRVGRKSKETGRKSKLNPSISFAEPSLFKGLCRPPGPFLTALVLRRHAQRGVSKDGPACATDNPDWTIPSASSGQALRDAMLRLVPRDEARTGGADPFLFGPFPASKAAAGA
jgi:hypothetical protein